ncbi:MAG: hypothetical protein DSY43_00960 [Gammaproteobacteria bacterium]|nr:MAG: hypothetical protein DSY43_00960 [Gammaproteobacteria bacterium]
MVCWAALALVKAWLTIGVDCSELTTGTSTNELVDVDCPNIPGLDCDNFSVTFATTWLTMRSTRLSGNEVVRGSVAEVEVGRLDASSCSTEVEDGVERDLFGPCADMERSCRLGGIVI